MNEYGVKRWLLRAWKIDREIQTLTELREKEYSRLTSVVPSYSGERVSSSKDPHKFDKLAILDDELAAQIEMLVSVKAEIVSAIRELQNGTFRTVLVKRYIDCETWEHIAVDMGYTYRQVCRIHGAALSAMRGVIKKMS